MSWTYLGETRPKARKPHRCALCGISIAVGEVHRKRIGANEDGLISSRMHEVCVEVTAGWDEDQWEYHDVAEFRDELAEHIKGSGGCRP